MKTEFNAQFSNLTWLRIQMYVERLYLRAPLFANFLCRAVDK